MVKLGLSLALISFILGGCSMLLGIKEIETTKDSTKYKFFTGINTEASISGTDTLNNNKGIKPNG